MFMKTSKLTSSYLECRWKIRYLAIFEALINFWCYWKQACYPRYARMYMINKHLSERSSVRRELRQSRLPQNHYSQPLSSTPTPRAQALPGFTCTNLILTLKCYERSHYVAENKGPDFWKPLCLLKYTSYLRKAKRLLMRNDLSVRRARRRVPAVTCLWAKAGGELVAFAKFKILRTNPASWWKQRVALWGTQQVVEK